MCIYKLCFVSYNPWIPYQVSMPSASAREDAAPFYRQSDETVWRTIKNGYHVTSRTRVVVLGAYGMLGHRLLLQLAHKHDVKGTCRRINERIPDNFLPRDLLFEGVDATGMQSVANCFSRFEPDVAVNCIGIVKQSELAKSPVPSITINSLFPHLVAELCAENGIRLVHFSTDCVFSGTKGNYRLSDPHDAQDLYGRTKSLGELDEKEGFTIRSSIVGRELESSHGLVEWLVSNRGKKVKGFTKAIFTGLTTHEMANVVGTILERPGLRGVRQVASEAISKFDLLSLIAKELALGIKVEPYPEYFCDRSLDGSLFQKETGYVAPAWKDMIASMAKDWSSYDAMKKAIG